MTLNLTVQEIAQITGAEAAQNAQTPVTKLCALDDAQEGSIATLPAWTMRTNWAR